jgi:hypothetical protein
MHGSNAQYAAGRHHCVIDFCKSAIGARQNEVVQDILAARKQRSLDAEAADPRCKISREVARGRPENQGKKIRIMARA